MRKELKSFDWHIHGLSERDFEVTIKLTEDLIQAKKNNYGLKRKE